MVKISRDKIVKYAELNGWKPWGKLRKYGGSYYQCFRKGNHYAWIGLASVEVSYHCLAYDFRFDPAEAKQLLKSVPPRKSSA